MFIQIKKQALNNVGNLEIAILTRKCLRSILKQHFSSTAWLFRLDSPWIFSCDAIKQKLYNIRIGTFTDASWLWWLKVFWVTERNRLIKCNVRNQLLVRFNNFQHAWRNIISFYRWRSATQKHRILCCHFYDSLYNAMCIWLYFYLYVNIFKGEDNVYFKLNNIFCEKLKWVMHFNFLSYAHVKFVQM